MKWLLDNWFTLALLALAACAMPGVVLVILRLFEVDGPINNWLLLTFQITYELRLSPWITLILLLLPVALLLLYFLRLKRTPMQVPSTFLWKKSVEDLHVNSLFQWLRENVLLILQLLVLLFLIYSVLGVRLHGSTMKSRHYILMIDNSASMSVKDVAPNRLEWAKQEALKEIDAASDSDFGMVIVFNSKATTLQAYTNDREKLRDAIRGITLTERPTRIEEALLLAASLANPVRSTEDLSMQPADVPDDQKRTMVQARGISTVVHVFSDGRFAKLSEQAIAKLKLRGPDDDPKQGGLNLRYHLAGSLAKPGNANNVGIILFNVHRQPIDAKKKADSQQLLAWVRLANVRAQSAAVRVKLDVYVEGEKRHSLEQSKTIPARKYVPAKADEEDDVDEPGEAEIRFDLPSLELRSNIVLHAYFVNQQDDFSLDDHAWLAVGTTRKAKVLIVTKGNSHLDAMFKQEGTQRIAIAEWMTPADLNGDEYRKKARAGDVDLVVFDRCVPADELDMPLANTLLIDRPPPPWRRGTAVLKNPLFIASQRDHPLLKHLTTINDIRTHEAFVFDVRKNLSAEAAKEADLPIGHAKHRTLPTVERIVETSNQTPLLFAMARGPHTDLVQTFPLTSDDGGLLSDWGLQPSFPLFFWNLLYILGKVDDSVRTVSVSPGEPMVLRPDAGFRFVQLTTPDQRKIKLPRTERNEIVFADTDKLGIYRYQVALAEDERRLVNEPRRGFAVNLLDSNETNIEPRPSIRIGNEPIVSGEKKSQTREIWKWILLLVVVLLLTEWIIYQRRIAV